MGRKKAKIIILKTGQRIRSKRINTVYEIKSIDGARAALMSEDGTEYLVVPVDSITPNEYEPVYN